MKVLVIGGGAREHALCRSLSLDPDVTALHCAPGNAGIAEVAELHEVDALDGRAVADLAVGLAADLVVVGPEARWSPASRTRSASAASRPSGRRPGPPSWRAPRRSPRT
ncbi:phosphoribosylamine--glycine ligase family protein [Streptomyces albulus]|nr:phosphoribosylamine--glycine ligase family protein [Streptomyces noursei]